MKRLFEKEMTATMAERFKTGEKAPENGTYIFEKLTDGRKNADATDDEFQIELKEGETFPPLKSSEEAAYWRKLQ